MNYRCQNCYLVQTFGHVSLDMWPGVNAVHPMTYTRSFVLLVELKMSSCLLFKIIKFKLGHLANHLCCFLSSKASVGILVARNFYNPPPFFKHTSAHTMFKSPGGNDGLPGFDGPTLGYIVKH